MSFNTIVLWIMAIGALLGGLDKILGNRFGLGKEFEKGYDTMGPLAMGMVGIVCLTPLLQKGISATAAPLCAAVGIDPAIFGSLLANDMGGYQLAMELATDPRAGQLSGLLVASTLGATLVFNIPVGLGIIEKEKQPLFVQGLLVGLVALPFGSFLGGLSAGFPLKLVAANIAPVAVIAIALAIGLKFIPRQMTKGCLIFGKLVGAAACVGLVCAGFESVTGVVLIPGMAPIEDAMATVAEIAIVLGGAFPVLAILMKVLNKPLTLVGKRLGLDFVSTSAMIFSLANSVSLFVLVKDMKKRGIIIATAWMVTTSAVLGDHLGFTASVDPTMIFPLVVTKVTGGIVAVLLGMYMTRGNAELDA